MSHRVCTVRFSKSTPFSVSSIIFVDIDVRSQFLAQHHPYLPAAMFFVRIVLDTDPLEL